VRDLVEGSLRAAQRRDRLVDHLSRQGRAFEPAAVEALRAGVRARRLQYDADLTAGSACYQHERTVHDGRKGWRLCDLVLRPEAWGPVIGVEVKAFCPTSGSATAMGDTVRADLGKLAMYRARKQVAFGVLVVLSLGVAESRVEEALRHATRGPRTYRRLDITPCAGMSGVLLALETSARAG
jgi:hypothetical protein